MPAFRHQVLALLLAASTPACVRGRAQSEVEAPQTSELESPASSVCQRPEGFDTLTRVRALEVLAGAQTAEPVWLKSWHRHLQRGLDEARARHDEVASVGCETAAGDAVVLTAYQGCLERAVIRLDAQLSVAAELLAQRAPELASAPAWTWSLARDFDACAAAKHRDGLGSLAAAELEAQARTGVEGLELAWARANFGDYEGARRGLTSSTESIRRGGDSPSVFSMHLLEGYLSLAEGKLGQAESQLAPAAALAPKLGPEAQMNLAFFRGTTATLAGDDAGARRSFLAAARQAQELVSGGAQSYAAEASEASLRAAQAAWRVGDEAAREQLIEAWSRADAAMLEDDPRRLDYLDAASQMGVELEGGAHSAAAIAEAMGVDWPGAS